ncbi:D-alanyl-D-alanine carboxypeptidase family protein [Bdellovibrio sp. HCB337]|uniref:M15 family metallopeptidase n=1 Tax=Bdellovibrio sp. HCB337 TaxID=3394358 RepID=UPI0039A4991A
MQKLLTEIHEYLGITQNYLETNRLSLHEQPPLEMLQIVDIDFEGKPFVLTTQTAKAWLQMRAAALQENIQLMPFSGFRSYLHQKNLIDKHLKNGRPLDDILTHIAIPGFSEHHSGRAIDIHAYGHPTLTEEFENTEEFAWLSKNAARFGFRLSYPRDNPHGIIYEPWHWFYTGS